MSGKHSEFRLPTSDFATTDVFAVGNALVDILTLVDDDFVREHALEKGAMTLVDAEKQGGLLNFLEGHELKLRSGGSAANTLIAVAQSGGTGFYAGKVARDAHGEFYRQDLLESGIHFDVHPAPDSIGSTGTCLVLTTPDAERTMCTHLGVSTKLAATDIDVQRLAHCKTSYVEGYLWDAPHPREACLETMQQSRRLGVPVAFTFSDPWLVDRFADDFRTLVREYCDILFCNADEVRRFCKNKSLTECARQVGQLAETVFVTDGANGCLVVQDQQVHPVPGFPVKAIDTVGAGDAFAGGVLYGLTNGLSCTQAARWGNYVASRVVQIYGARLEDEALAAQVAPVVGR
jgi:sugar/nucleoside kinase (ribokinase family)